MCIHTSEFVSHNLNPFFTIHIIINFNIEASALEMTNDILVKRQAKCFTQNLEDKRIYSLNNQILVHPRETYSHILNKQHSKVYFIIL